MLIVDIDDDVDSSETCYQGNAEPQRHECQPVPNPANQYRWFPETSSSSSSDKTSDKLSPADPTIRPSPYVEDEETIMSKRILVDKLFVEEDVGFSCKACQYRTNSKRRLIQHIHCIHHNGPIARCGECGSLHKNTHALQAHVYRSHRDAWGASNLPTSHAKPPAPSSSSPNPPTHQ